MKLTLSSLTFVVEYGIIKKSGKGPLVAKVMKETDRKLYCKVANPYVDRPYTIGFSATISAPHMHAYSLDILQNQLHPNARVSSLTAVLENSHMS